jgi:hypothetical protein
LALEGGDVPGAIDPEVNADNPFGLKVQEELFAPCLRALEV